MITLSLIRAILQQYQLSGHGIHGPVHWARVLENGQRLAAVTGASLAVVELFAVFHDACRVNDDFDPEHGSRGAALAAKFRGKHFELGDKEFTALSVACRLHTAGLTEADVTVQTCWDADRLDLGRVGVKPRRKKLCTAAARDFSLLEWADNRACGGHIPDFTEQWLRAGIEGEIINKDISKIAIR
jgi:uncharacterized protein